MATNEEARDRIDSCLDQLFALDRSKMSRQQKGRQSYSVMLLGQELARVRRKPMANNYRDINRKLAVATSRLIKIREERDEFTKTLEMANKLFSAINRVIALAN